MSEGERSPLGSQAVHEDATTPNLRKGLCVPCAPRRAPPALLSLRRRRPPALPARGALLTVSPTRAAAPPSRRPAAPPPRRPAARASRGQEGGGPPGCGRRLDFHRPDPLAQGALRPRRHGWRREPGSAGVHGRVWVHPQQGRLEERSALRARPALRAHASYALATRGRRVPPMQQESLPLTAAVVPYPDEQIKRLFMQIDANSDGGIDWQDSQKMPCLLFAPYVDGGPDFVGVCAGMSSARTCSWRACPATL